MIYHFSKIQNAMIKFSILKKIKLDSKQKVLIFMILKTKMIDLKLFLIMNTIKVSNKNFKFKININ